MTEPSTALVRACRERGRIGACNRMPPHGGRRRGPTPRARFSVQANPSGLCECGCGERVTPGKRFLKGHNARAQFPSWPGRFWDKVDVRGPDECWPWKAGRYTPNGGCAYGYGQCRDPALGRSTQAHRIAALLVHGPPPPGMPNVLHSCDYEPCCNPAHLRYGTQAENMREAHQRKRGAYGERSGMAKLTDDAVRFIREAYFDGTATMDLARLYDVDRSTIRRVIRRERWGHVR